MDPQLLLLIDFFLVPLCLIGGPLSVRSKPWPTNILIFVLAITIVVSMVGFHFHLVTGACKLDVSACMEANYYFGVVRFWYSIAFGAGLVFLFYTLMRTKSA